MNELRDESKRIKRLIDIDKSTLPPDGGLLYNRLIFSTSPYLIQHADNPVDWYPWGEEAFSRAAEKDLPVFLSIGYSTCHWCHVMEHESFENPEVAAAMNRTFVCIKVDREERPDIDEQYMAVAQLMTGSGGWPLNIFMGHDRKPFYAATYIPIQSNAGMPGIIDLFEYFHRLWRTDRQKLEAGSATALKSLESFFRHEPGPLPGEKLMHEAVRQLSGIYDREYGGFGSSPKFPMPVFVDFLLNRGCKGDSQALGMAENSLRSMRGGGIYDQLGFGFHRYSTDCRWLVPHFEKMLYDQALITLNYLKAFQLTSNRFYLEVAEEILSYVNDELTSPEGGFYSGQDADIGGSEGSSYLWTPDEVTEVLGEEDSLIFCRLFDLTGSGNFEGKNILNLPKTVEMFASEQGVDAGALKGKIAIWRKTLLSERNLRMQPFRDEKIITAWNGLMISAYAKCYAITGNGSYLSVAERAAAFILRNLTDSTGRLMRSFHLGAHSEKGFLDDYACFTNALVHLHQVTLDKNYLDKGCFFAREMLRLFGGESCGALYETGSDGEKLLLRHRVARDGVVPSGNSSAADLLFRLASITGDDSFKKSGEGILLDFMGSIGENPLNSLYFLSAFDCGSSPAVSISIAGEAGSLAGLICASHSRFMPNLTLRYAGDGDDEGFRVVDGNCSAWLCAKGSCRRAVSSPEELKDLLDEVA